MKKDGGGRPSDADYNGDNDENTVVQLEVVVLVGGVLLKPSDDNDTASLDLCWIIQRVKLG